MEKKYLDQLTSEVLNFMIKLLKNVNHNPYFVNILEYEISHILLNKGQVFIKEGALVGSYTSKSTMWERLTGKIGQTLKGTLVESYASKSNVWQKLTGKTRQTLRVTTGKEESYILIECPKVTYMCDNPEHIYYGKEVKSYFRSGTTYGQNKLKGLAECKINTINNQSANVSPRLTHVSDKNFETTIQFDSDNKDIFYSQTQNSKEGYQDFRINKFIKYGSDASDKSTITINRLVNYSIIDVLDFTNGNKKNRKFIVESQDSELKSIAEWKQNWRPLSPSEYIQLMKDGEVLEEVNKKLLKQKNLRL